MKALQLLDGDLVIGSSSDYQPVTGAPKVQQDLRCALAEPLGVDRFHPGWGSTLSTFPGLSLTEITRSQVLGEVNRVVGNYAAIQRDQVEADVLSSESSRFTTDEIVASVSEVRTNPVLDGMSVSVSVTTVSGSTAQIDEVF